MKKQLLKKTLLLFTFLGLLSTQMNAQDETFLDTTSDGLWSTIGNWVNTGTTTTSTALPTGEAVVKFSVNLNGNQTTSSIKAALASANPITVSSGVLTIGSSANNATIINNNINNQFIFDCDINFVSTAANQRIRNKSNASAELIFNAGRTISLNGVRLKIQNQSPSNNVQLNGTVIGTNSIELEGNSTQNGWSGLTFGSASDFSGFTGNYFLYRYEIESNTNTIFLKASNRIQFANIGGILTVNGTNTLEGEIRRNDWTGGIGESTVNFNANQNNMAKLTLSSDERMIFNIGAAVTELYFTTSTFTAASVLNINGFQNGILKFDNTVTQTVLDTWELNGVSQTPGTLEQDASGFINIVCTTPTDVTGFTVTDAGATQLDLAWTNTTCFDEILVVAKEATAVTFTPSGDGSLYSANAAFGSSPDLGGSEYAVYKGVGNSISVTGLTTGTVYHFTVFARKGTSWTTPGVTGDGTPTPPVAATFEDYAGAEEADATMIGTIEPAANGNESVTGWYFNGHTNNYEFSDEQQATGDYSLKFDSNGASGARSFYYAELGRTAAPALSKSSFGIGTYEVELKAFIGSNPPSQIQTVLAPGGTNPATVTINWDLSTASIPVSDYGKWITMYQIIDIATAGTDEVLQFKLRHLDMPGAVLGVVPTNQTILYFDDFSIKPFTQVETAGTFGTTPVDWGTPSTWAAGVVPGPDDNVLINDRINMFSNRTIKNLEITSNADALNVQKGINLTVTRDVDTSNRLNLYSDSDEFASLIVNGETTGFIRYYRFIAASGTNDLISSPVSNLDFGTFSGAGWNTQLLANPANTTEIFFGPFNNLSGLYENYDTAANSTTELISGKGYRTADDPAVARNTFFFAGNDTNNDTVTISITDETASNTFGAWNLIGNPYPTYLDFTPFLTTNLAQLGTGFEAVYGYNGAPSGNVWTIYNLSNLPVNNIAPGQGFFVNAKANAGAVQDDTQITFTPAMRVTGSGDDFNGANRAANTLNRALTKLFLSKDSSTYNTSIYFIDNQSRGLDAGYDAGAFGGNGEVIYTHLVEDNTGIDMAIQALPYQDFNDIVVPVGVNVALGDQATIGLDNTTTTIPSNINVYLEDNVTNTWTLLNTSDYTFTPSVTLNGTGRFYIHFSNAVLSINENRFDALNIYTEQSSKQVIVKGQLDSDTIATIYDIQGRAVLSKTLIQNSTTNTIDVSNLFTGIYIVKLENTSGSRTQKVILR